MGSPVGPAPRPRWSKALLARNSTSMANPSSSRSSRVSRACSVAVRGFSDSSDRFSSTDGASSRRVPSAVKVRRSTTLKPDPSRVSSAILYLSKSRPLGEFLETISLTNKHKRQQARGAQQGALQWLLNATRRIAGRRRRGKRHETEALQKEDGALRSAAPDELAAVTLTVLDVNVAPGVFQTTVPEGAIDKDAVVQHQMLILKCLAFVSVHDKLGYHCREFNCNRALAKRCYPSSAIGALLDSLHVRYPHFTRRACLLLTHQRQRLRNHGVNISQFLASDGIRRQDVDHISQRAQKNPLPEIKVIEPGLQGGKITRVFSPELKRRHGPDHASIAHGGMIFQPRKLLTMS